MAEKHSILDYLTHHLENWRIGSGFWSLNLDSILVSLLLGGTILGVLYYVSRQPINRAPSRFELVVEWIALTCRSVVLGVFPKGHLLLESAAVFIMLWIMAMNAMDFLPVDLLPNFFGWVGISHFRPVPTADCNITFGMGIAAILFIWVELWRQMGIKGSIRHVASHPFGLLAFPLNLFLNLQGFVAKAVTFGLRLFLNMLIGGLLFLGLGMVGQLALTYHFQSAWFLLQPLAYAFAAALHALAVVLQAFIFTLLLVVYTSIELGDTH